jgi:hypothetical protein
MKGQSAGVWTMEGMRVPAECMMAIGDLIHGSSGGTGDGDGNIGRKAANGDA